MKTRQQLRAEGIELHGPIVPGWFKAQSDGCSVPTRIAQFFLKAEQTRAACYIHDFEYYLFSIQYHDSDPRWQDRRWAADNHLRRNRALVAHNRFIGWIYSRLYFRGVRIGGKYAMKLAPNLFVPPTVDHIQALAKDHLRKPLTPQAEATIEKWTRLRD